METAVIFTDGSAGKESRGGWASLVVTPQSNTIVSGSELVATNNRMEILAAIRGIEELSGPHTIFLVSDSAYMLNSIKRKWYKLWFEDEKRGKTRPNIDLWHIVAQMAEYHSIICVKVKGHTNIKYNLLIDKMAVNSRQGQLPFIRQEYDLEDTPKQTMIKRAYIFNANAPSQPF